MRINEATKIAGTLGYPSKMPGTAYGIPAQACLIGSKLAKVPGSVCHGCYAMRGNYITGSVQKSQATRLAAITDPYWIPAMVALLQAAHKRGTGRNGQFSKGWHRWHDSGDLQSVEHLTRICTVAALTPEIKHWLPTRELGIVQQYQKQGGQIPSNLVIRVSATMVDGAATKAWPTTSGVHNKLAAPGHECPAPKQDNNCGDCRACWSHDVEHVSYHKH